MPLHVLIWKGCSIPKFLFAFAIVCSQFSFYVNFDGTNINKKYSTMQSKVLKNYFTRYNCINKLIKNNYFISKSAITKALKMTDAMPFVVKNARFILLKSLCFTKVCWYMSSAEKIQKPIQ